MRKYQRFPLCLIEPMPASSKSDLLLVKAKSISYSGSTSAITYLRRGKKLLHDTSWERGVRICDTNNSAGTKITEEGGRRCSGHQSRGSLGGEDRGEARLFPQWSRYAPCSPRGSPCRGGWVPEGGCGPGESPCWSRLLTGPVLFREEPTLGQVCWQDF